MSGRMSNGVVGHPVEDDGSGHCGYPDCGRRTGVYGGILQHRRGSGGKRGATTYTRMPAHEARRRVATMEHEHAAEMARLRAELDALIDERAALLERIAALTIEAHPWTAVHAKLDALLKRPAGVTPITHRRIKDGGTGGKKERRSQMSLSA